VRIHLTNPPVISPGAEPGTVVVKVKGADIQGQFKLGHGHKDIQAQADVTLQGTLSLDEGGKSLRFTPTGQPHLIDSLNISKDSLGPIRIRHLIEKAITSKLVSSGLLSWIASRAVPVPFQMQLTGVQAGPDGLALYTKLPDDPSAFIEDTNPPQPLK
jgi:hypothetical protein